VIRLAVELSMINGRAPLTNEQSIRKLLRDFPRLPMVATSNSIVKKVINEKTADTSNAARLIRSNFTFAG
jgi:hypothetical protein